MATCPAAAQETYWAQLEPLVDAKTFAVIHITQNKKFEPIWNDLAFDQGRPYDSFRYMFTFLQRLAAAGIDDVTIILRFESSQDPILFAFRDSNQVGPEQVRKLCSGFGWRIDVADYRGWTLIGNASTIASIQADRLRQPLGSWEAALQSVADDELQIAVALNADQRRVFAELTPQSSAEPVQTSIAGIQAVDWASVGISNPDAFELRGTFSCFDDNAVHSLQSAFEWFQQFANLNAEYQPYLKSLGDLVVAFKVTPQSNQLRFDSADDPAVAFRLTANVRQLRESLLANLAMRTSKARIRELAISFHDYHDAQQALPLPSIASAEGKPLLSWRVTILPFLGEKKLYDAFHMDEPWDSPHNKALIPKMPDYFLDPRSGWKREDGKTNYLIPVSNGAAFELGEKVTLASISNLDGTSKTIMMFEADDTHAQIWTDPQPFIYNPENPLNGLFPQVPLVAMCDCTVRTIDPNDRQAVGDLFSKNGDGQGETPAPKK